jgi:hypothetical protein
VMPADVHYANLMLSIERNYTLSQGVGCGNRDAKVCGEPGAPLQ